MRISYLFSLLVLLPYVFLYTTGPCDIFKCSESKLQKDICMVSGIESVGEETRTIYYLDNCSSSKKCQFIGDSYGVCIKPYPSLGFTGDKCHQDEECISRNCEDKKCKPKSVGASCSENSQCDDESACVYNKEVSDYICKKLVGKGDKCISDNECPFNTVCSGTRNNEGTCIDYFSLGVGEVSYNELACASGQIYSYHLSSGSKKSVCAEHTLKEPTCDQSDVKTGYHCKISINYSTAEGVGPIDDIVDCVCKPNGEFGCPALSDSESFKNYVEVYKKEIEKVKTKGVQISNMDRHHWYNKKIKDAYMRYSLYPQLEGADECYEHYILDSNHLHVYMITLIGLLSLMM